MSDFLQDLERLDANGDSVGALRLIAERRPGLAALIQIATTLYERHHDATAFLIARKLGEQGVDHWALDAVRAHVSALVDLEAPAATERLRRALGGLDPESAAQCRRLLESRLCDDVMTLSAATDTDVLLRLLEVAKLATPALEGFFPSRPSAAPIPGGAPPKLLAFPDPPPPSARRPRSAVVLAPEFNNPADPRSGRADIGPRLIAAMTRYGWSARHAPMRSADDSVVMARDQAAALAMCEAGGADILVAIEYGVTPMAGFFAELRSRLPGLVIVMLTPDPWVRKRWSAFQAAGREAHGVWAPFPANPLWRRPEFDGKMLFFPLPPGPPRPPPDYPAGLSLSFTGSVRVFNWMRVFWLAALHGHGVPVQHHVSSPSDDGLPPLVSYARYLDRLAASGCALNLCVRSGGERTLLGRPFEALWSGALLVEEHSDEIEYYFTPNQHLLKFSTLPELLEIVSFIRERPQDAEAIRRRGHAFTNARYSDERIIGGLDRLLWPEDARAVLGFRSPPA